MVKILPSEKPAGPWWRGRAAAFVGPFALFLALLMARDGLGAWAGADESVPFWLRRSEFWIFPLQTVLCGAACVFWWRVYAFAWPGPRALAVSLAAGLGVFLVWIAPQEWLGFGARVEGFNPDLLKDQPAAQGATYVLRFLRLVVVVPIVEEVFWRGFLLRCFINEDFEEVALGEFSWMSFLGVTLFFGLAHWGPDFVPALLCGACYNAVLMGTKSLSACVFAHALTNFLLGVYIVRTGQWGFW